MPAEQKFTATSRIEFVINCEAKTHDDAWDQLQDFAVWLLENSQRAADLYLAEKKLNVNLTLKRS